MSTKPVTLTVIFHGDKWTTFTEMFTDSHAAGERVADIAETMGAYIEDAHTAPLMQGYLMRDVPNATPFRITEVVANYDIEEN